MTMASQERSGRKEVKRDRPDGLTVRFDLVHIYISANIQPVRPQPKAKPLSVPQVKDDASDQEDGVAASQVNPDQIDDQNTSNDEYGSDYATDDSQPSKKRRSQCKKRDSAITTTSTEKKSTEGPIKQAARKVKATAHANYRRLKIKNKGGNGGKGRFGRRR